MSDPQPHRTGLNQPRGPSTPQADPAGEVLWLVRLARMSGQVTDEYALAALIDVEIELEPIENIEDALPLDWSIPPAEAISHALVLARGSAGVPPAVAGWLAEALRFVVQP